MYCTHIAFHNLDSFDLDTWTNFTPNGNDVSVALRCITRLFHMNIRLLEGYL